MRDVLSEAIARTAEAHPDFMLLSGDHGYALFDEIRKRKPDQFLNVGIMEQALVGVAAGMARRGIKPMCYGLASFVPIRVLEQIKFDVCLSKLPVKIIGDGAGLVYTQLGNSHLCAEDIACLRPLPEIEIFSPGDAEEMRICYEEFFQSTSPAYLRVGKADNPAVNSENLKSTNPYFTYKNDRYDVCFVSTGASLGHTHLNAKKFDVSHVSIMKVKTLDPNVIELLQQYKQVYVFEEHTRVGGLASAIADLFIEKETPLPRLKSLGLNSSFIENCGSYQYAMSEHGASNMQIETYLTDVLGAR